LSRPPSQTAELNALARRKSSNSGRNRSTVEGEPVEEPRAKTRPVAASEARETLAPLRGSTVEVTVPGKDVFNAPVECRAAHVGDDPFLLRQPLTRQGVH